MNWEAKLTTKRFFRSALAKPSTKQAFIIFAIGLALMSFIVAQSNFLLLLIPSYIFFSILFFGGLYMASAIKVSRWRKKFSESILRYQLDSQRLKVSIPGKDEVILSRTQIKLVNEIPGALVVLQKENRFRQEAILLFDDQTTLEQVKKELSQNKHRGARVKK